MRDAACVAAAPQSNLTDLRAEAVAIFRAAIDAVQPAKLVRDALQWKDGSAFVAAGGLSPRRLTLPVTVVGAGKAAAAMALGCEQALGAANVEGEVIAPDGTDAQPVSVRIHRARHPLPDVRGVEATRSLLRHLQQGTASPLLCLVSGGASSLLVRPRAPLLLKDKVETNRLLLECGADIHEMNTVRKHLSDVKGGGLLRHCTAEVVSLLISDVVGDDPGTIGSGPTCADATTFADALRILDKYQLREYLPAAVVRLLMDGSRGQANETVKPGSVEALRGVNAVIGSNLVALQGASATAAARGWAVHIVTAPITGDTSTAAGAFRNLLRQHRRKGYRVCVLAGGETTVKVRGRGRGGRNQEFALALARLLAGEPVVVLSAGTDGVDGPTDAAGAFVDGRTRDRGADLGIDADAALAANDSYTFFEKLSDLFVPGPTGTNVMDIKIALLTD